MRRSVGFLVAAFACLVLLPNAAHAQSAIVGVVKDTSGAVLPGVTVEASSDVLIEKTRSVTTDGNGQYKIVDLRPGQYVVTFSLTGFASIKRENVDLPANFTSAINADMRVGSLEESITVSASSPVVDVTTAAHAQVLNREAIDAIPDWPHDSGMGQLIVGVSLSLPDTGGARAMQQTYMSTHGMTTANNTVMVDGMMVNGLQSDGRCAELLQRRDEPGSGYQTSGIGAETSAGGVRLNMIPREGGNRFSGDFKTAYRPSSWQGDNVGARLQSLGVKPNAGNGIDRIIDATVSEGGPIKKDKLWFFSTARYFSVNNFIANTVLDDGSRGVDDQFIRSALLRLTWQVTPNEVWRVPRRDRQVPRPRHAEPVRSGNGRDGLEFARVSHQPGQADDDGHEPAAPRRWILQQPRVLHQPVSRRHRAAARYRRVVCEHRSERSASSAASSAPPRARPRRVRRDSTGRARPRT